MKTKFTLQSEAQTAINKPEYIGKRRKFFTRIDPGSHGYVLSLTLWGQGLKNS